MIKIYKLIENPRVMTFDELYDEYKGKWIFLVNPEIPEGSTRFERALPVIVADRAFDGFDTGIYQKLQEENGGSSFNLSFLPNEHNVFGFNEVFLQDDN